MADNSITVIGNITRDPELRFTPSAQPVATFGLAVNRRWQNRQTQQWEESASFFDVTCWGSLAENVAESVGKGARLVVTGRLEQRSWESQDGEKRSKVEIVADEVGPSLRWATARPEKTDRRGGTGGSNEGAAAGGGGYQGASPGGGQGQGGPGYAGAGAGAGDASPGGGPGYDQGGGYANQGSASGYDHDEEPF